MYSCRALYYSSTTVSTYFSVGTEKFCNRPELTVRTLPGGSPESYYLDAQKPFES